MSPAIDDMPSKNPELVLNFLQRTSSGFLAGMSSLAGDIQQLVGVGVFAAKIPVINKTLGQIMADVADPITVANDSISLVSSTFDGLLNQKFTVTLSSGDLVKQGVGVGDAVFYQSGGHEVQG